MTVKQAFNELKALLGESQIDNCEFEASILMQSILCCRRADLVLKGDMELDFETCELIRSRASQRVLGYPLQYIIKEWSFWRYDFEVGEGVLIPRPETELLVEKALEFIPKDSELVVYDICAGSGCIGLSIAKERPACFVYLFELYDDAFSYLQKNIKRHELSNVEAVRCDVLNFAPNALPLADVMLSNPPYIETSELKLLQREVQFEPQTALDGGSDGYSFYHAIAENWLPCLKAGGLLGLECGEMQPPYVASLCQGKGLTCETVKDCFDVERFVVGRRI